MKPLILLVLASALVGCGSAENSATTATAKVSYPSPDDYFNESSFNTNRWNKTVSSGSLDLTGADLLKWTESTADPATANIQTRYVVTDMSFNLDLDVWINSVSLNGSGVEFRLFFNEADLSCDYISFILERTSGGANQLRVIRCDGGSIITQNTIANPGYSMSIRVERDQANGRVRFYYDTGSGYNIAGTVSTGMTANTTYFNNSARPTIYFMNPNTGTVEVEIDNWSINNAECSWDY